MKIKLKLFNTKKASQLSESQQPNNNQTQEQDTQSLTNPNPKKTFSFTFSKELAGSGIKIIPTVANHLLDKIDGNPITKLTKLSGEKSIIDNILKDNTLKALPSKNEYTKRELNSKLEKLGKQIDDVQAKAETKLARKSDYLEEKSELKQKWQEATTAEKFTALGIGISVSPLVALGQKIKELESYKEFQEARENRNKKYEDRKEKYIIEQNTNSRAKQAQKVEKILGNTEFNGNSIEPDHEQLTEAIAVFRSTHGIRSVPLLGLGRKYDTKENQKKSVWNMSNLFSLKNNSHLKNSENLENLETDDNESISSASSANHL